MKRLIKKANIDRSQFTEEQLELIDKALKDGLNIDKYLNPDIASGQMYYIFYGLRKGYDVSLYDDWKKYDVGQMQQICDGLDMNIDVSIYANPDFNAGQMYCIREALVEEYPIERFLDKNMTVEQMYKLKDQFYNLKITVKRHDFTSRDRALVYFNDKFYSGRTHAYCLNMALEEQNREKLSRSYFRPSKSEVENTTVKEDTMFFAHIVENPLDKEDYDGTKNEKSIYIIPDSYLLKNITLEEAAQIIKSSQKYSDYKVFKDEDSYLDYDEMVRVFPRLAKLKNMKKLMKIIYG